MTSQALVVKHDEEVLFQHFLQPRGCGKRIAGLSPTCVDFEGMEDLLSDVSTKFKNRIENDRQ